MNHYKENIQNPIQSITKYISKHIKSENAHNTLTDSAFTESLVEVRIQCIKIQPQLDVTSFPKHWNPSQLKILKWCTIKVSNHQDLHNA